MGCRLNVWLKLWIVLGAAFLALGLCFTVDWSGYPDYVAWSSVYLLLAAWAVAGAMAYASGRLIAYLRKGRGIHWFKIMLALATSSLILPATEGLEWYVQIILFIPCLIGISYADEKIRHEVYLLQRTANKVSPFVAIVMLCIVCYATGYCTASPEKMSFMTKSAFVAFACLFAMLGSSILMEQPPSEATLP